MKRKPLSGAGGFTLLELTIAAALAAVLAGAVATLFSRGVFAWQRADGRLQRLFQMEKGLEGIGLELRNGVAVQDGPFDGEEDRFSFASEEPSSPGSPPHLVRIGYRLEGEGKSAGLVRSRQLLAPPKEGPDIRADLAIPQVTHLRVQYAAAGEKDSPQGGRIVWLDRWDPSKQRSRFPELVRVRIDAEEPGGSVRSVRRDFWIPQGVLGEAAVE